MDLQNFFLIIHSNTNLHQPLQSVTSPYLNYPLLADYMYWISQYNKMIGYQGQNQQKHLNQIKVENSVEQNFAKIQENLIQNSQLDSKYQESEYLLDSNSQKKQIRINRPKITNKIKKINKPKDKNDQKNLLVHLKLWLERYFEELGHIQPTIKKQFQHVFRRKSHNNNKYIYMNMALFSKLLQNQILRPSLKQFFEKRILRHLMTSNIKNKLSIIKFIPILLQKFSEGKCKSLK